MKLWVTFVVIYGILKGAREPIKKKILGDVNVLTTLFAYSAVGFIMVAPFSVGIFDIPIDIFMLVLLKSASIVVAWLMMFESIKHVPVSIYGITDSSRVIFSTLMGVLFFKETLKLLGVVSLLLVAFGLFLANYKKRAGSNAEKYEIKYVFIIMLGCLLNAVSGTLDKYLMSTGKITESAMQFWFMLTMAAMYLLCIVLRREKFEIKKAIKNPWIYALSLFLVVGDRLLFMANSDPESLVTVMTLIKQSSTVVTIILGKVVYKEKNMIRKFISAAIIITGIMISVL
ncbi:MAG: EamA family transporter [Clostridia bacterium]|nr:EamA family transporter [Clostridia bacterium]